jgi:UDP-GlcNAc:undecaprenyl-phosphate/decaprenyl-phosphate GlcNAc-1-phosphate transferase
VPIALLAGVAVAIAVVGLLRWKAYLLPVARPGTRTLHDAPVVRVGGLAILAGIAAGLPASGVPAGLTPSLAWAALLGATLVALVSLVDDCRGTHASTRLVAQLIAAALATWAMPVAATLALPVVLAIVWMANLFNFMDGSDGLAASAAVCGFAAYAAAAHASGADPWPYALVAAACLPFLALNLPPAKLFMGDVGSVTLGFGAAVLGIAGVVGGTWAAWLPLTAFIAPIEDATLTLGARALRGERVWQAHRDHYYQRFHRMGAGHRGTLALYAALSLATSASAVACHVLAPRVGWVLLAAWVVALAGLFAAIDYHWRRRPHDR